MSRFTLNPIADSYLLVVLVAIALTALLWIRPPVEPKRRRILTLLRVGTILLLLVVMLRPTIVRVEEVPQAATLVVLADRSRSMTVPDASGGDETRYAAMRETLDTSAEPMAKLAERFEVQSFSFADSLDDVEMEAGRLKLPEKAEGPETAIGHAISEITRREAGKRLLGVILLSDGAQRAYPPLDTAPQTAATRLKHLGCPLFTVPFGQAHGLGQAKDVAVVDLLTNEYVFVKNRLPVDAKVRVNGYTNRDITVRLLFESVSDNPSGNGKMQVVDQKVIRATRPDELVPVQLGYAPETPGQFKVTVDVPDQAGELVTTNNSQSTFVTVLAGGLNVLYLEGSPPRIDTRFLRSALDASPDIEVDYLSLSKLSRPGELLDRFKPGRYNVYILGNVDSTAFSEEEMKALADAVQRGSGLILLGGFQSFGAGGYADTPLAEVSPIMMNRLERQEPGATIREDLHLPGPIEMLPTDIGNRHFIMTLSGDRAANRRLWQDLPPLEVANKFERLKPSAVVLAEDPNSRPLLVTQTFGSGRVIAFASHGTWRWAMQGFGNLHKRYWRQVILWLSRKDLTEENRVWVTPEQLRVRPGGQLKFTTGARSPNGDPILDVQIDAELVLPDGSTKPLRTQRTKDHRSGTLEVPQTTGDYAIRVRATESSGTLLGTATGRFLVFEEDLELDNPSADINGLESLAAMTDGRMVVAEQLPALLTELLEKTDELVTRTEVRRTLWDNWWILLLITTLLGVEWYLRKRWGQV